MLHPLYVLYGTPAGVAELLKMKPYMVEPLTTDVRLLSSSIMEPVLLVK